MKKIIQTDNAPQAIGTYSQAVLVDKTLYASGQIPLDPKTMTIVSNDFEAQAYQVFKNFRAVLEASGGDLSHVVKLTIFLTDLSNFNMVNEVMSQYFNEPYPARVALEVSRLPKDVKIEIEGTAVLD
ncbi:RidA family protein [Thiotrichales bacterium 19S9-12]|nr:RidA family protein [Thiotrichales bacterium 19S9-11]MCF6811910.1 RidA family protein [Thiotrichales bacterium 19S9-12]